MTRFVDDTHVGLGDQVYLRPFVLGMAGREPVYMATPWPELWAGTDVRPVPAAKGLRTQSANLAAAPPEVWHDPPAGAWRYTLTYSRDLVERRIPIVESLERRTGITPADWSLPIRPAWRRAADQVAGGRARRLAIVHPLTCRAEWRCPARNPRPEYLTQFADWLRADGFTLMAIGWLDEPAEVLVGELPAVDYAYMRGELHWTTVAALMARAAVVVTAPGFMVPLGLAVGANLATIYGGYVPSSMLVDPRAVTGTSISIEPERFCWCNHNGHECEKTISPGRLRRGYELCLE